MRILVTWGSKHGGTAGIGRILAEALRQHGMEIVATSVDDVKTLAGFDAAIIGGALYANRWPANVRRFARRHVAELRALPVWLFSSGPLDDSADREDVAAPTEVAVLGERLGAKGHVTFGGKLDRHAKGFPTSKLAAAHSGDFRNPERIRAWAAAVAAKLPHAAPGRPVEHPARAVSRLLAHGFALWLGCAAIMGLLLRVVSLASALVLHGLAAPVVAALIARHYFRERGAREPLQAAAVWTGSVALLDLVIVAALVQRSLAMFASVGGTWLPLTLIFGSSWATGTIVAMLPSTKNEAQT